jgi:hypothetical protein
MPDEIPAIALGKTAAQIQAATGVSQHDAEAIARVAKMSVDEFAQASREALQPIMSRLLQKISGEMDTLKGAQAAIVYGILADKYQQGPKVLNQALHLHIKGDAGSALRTILGPAAQSVFADAGKQDSKAPNYLDVATVPSDATESMQGDSKSPARKK